MLLETALKKLNSIPDNIAEELDRLNKKIFTVPKGTLTEDNFEPLLASKLLHLPDDTGKEISDIKNILIDGVVLDNSITTKKLSENVRNSISSIGAVGNLTTTAKDNLVNAINEIASSMGSSDLATEVETVKTSVSSIESTVGTLGTSVTKLENDVKAIPVNTITSGTGNPSGGKHGDIYIKYV